MRTRKSVRLVIFNVLFFIAITILFSGKSLGFDPELGPVRFALSIALALFGIFMFFFGNFMIIILPNKTTCKIDKLQTVTDYIQALVQFMKTDPAFKTEISRAIEQLETLQRRNNSLVSLLEQNGISENFKSLHQTAHQAEHCILNNVKSIISRLIVFDNKEYDSNPNTVDIKSHRDFINEKLESTQVLLNNYSELLTALTHIGDTSDKAAIEEIQDMTEALNRVLKGND